MNFFKHISGNNKIRSARGTDDDISLNELLLQGIERHRFTVEFFRQQFGLCQRPVGHDNRLSAFFNELCAGELRHLSGADQQDYFAGKRSKDFLGQLHRGVAHRNGIDGNAGFGADAFGRAERAVHQTVYNDAGSVFGQRFAIGILHLPENLRFAHNHRIKAGRHSENVAHRVFASIFIKAIGSFGLVQTAVSCQESAEFFESVAVFRNTGENLHTIAGGKIQHLLHAADGTQRREQIFFLLTAGENFFPDS